MIKVALIEDNADDRARFEKIFSDYCKKQKLEYELTLFSDGKSFFDEFICQYDLLYMDIELPDSDGLEISRKVRAVDKRVILVFLTNLGQFAINGYEVDALDFTLKPLNADVFAIKMKKVLRYLARNQKSNVNIVLDGGRKIIKSKNILYVEVRKHDLLYHTVNEVYVERGALKNIEEQLKDVFFARPNYCYIVNLRHVSQIVKYELHLDNGEVLLISRNRKKSFMDELSKYLGGTL